MSSTQNQFVPDKGEVEITVTSDDVTALASYGTFEAGDYVFDKILNKWDNPERPKRKVSQYPVVGGTVENVGSDKGIFRYMATVVDDYMLGATGEYGATNQFTLVELLIAFKKAERQISSMRVTPAGSSATYLTIPLTNVSVSDVSESIIDAGTEDPATREIELVVNKDNRGTPAAHG